MLGVTWIKQNNEFNTSGTDVPSQVAVGSNGDLYVTYQTNGTVADSLNGVTGVPNAKTTNAIGGTDIVVMKMDSSGNVVWTKQNNTFNTTGTNSSPQIVFDSVNDALYVTFQTSGTVQGDGNAKTTTTILVGTDIAVIKMDLDGNVVWTKQNNTFNTRGINSNPHILIHSDELYISYETTGTAPGGTRSAPNDVVVMKMSLDGVVLWIKQNSGFNSTGIQSSSDIAINSNGDLYLTYETTGNVPGKTKCGIKDIVVAKIALDGTVVWVKQESSFNSTGIETNAKTAVDSNGDIYVAYETTGVVADVVTGELMTPGNRKTTNAIVGTDIVIIKMDSTGEVVWTKQDKDFNTTGMNSKPQIAIDSDGVLFVTYHTTGTATNDIRNGSDEDIVVFRMTPTRMIESIKQNDQFNTTSSDVCAKISVDLDSVYVVFETSGNVAGFGNGRTSGGSNKDIAIMRMQKSDMTPYMPPTITLGNIDLGTPGEITFNWTIDTAETDYEYTIYVSDISKNYQILIPSTAYSSPFVANYIIANGPALPLNPVFFAIIGTRTDGSDTITNLVESEQVTVCLLKGTLVKTQNSYVPIEDLQVGDLVLNHKHEPTKITKTINQVISYKPILVGNEINRTIYKIPAGEYGATKDLFLTHHHRFLANGKMLKPLEAGLEKAKPEEFCDEYKKYTVYHLRLEDEYNNNFIVNGDCVVEDWYDWPRPNEF